MLFALALVGVVVSRAGGPESHDEAVASVPADDATALASDPPQLPGPEDAAAEAVAMTGDVVSAGLISRRELIESFTTPDFGQELADLTSEQVTGMRLSMTGTGRAADGWSVAEFPLRTRTVTADAEQAQVEVWSVLIVASATEPVARQAWRTVTVDLAMVEGRWLVDGWESVDGPAPAVSPSGSFAPGGEVVARLGWSEVG